MKQAKRFLAVVLTLAMVLGLMIPMPLSVSAEAYDSPPGTLGAEVYRNDFSSGTLGGFIWGLNGGVSIKNDPEQGAYLSIPANDNKGCHYATDLVLTPGDTYLLSVTYKTGSQTANMAIGVGGAPDEWQHWSDKTASWLWSYMDLPNSADWTTRYLLFTAGERNYSNTILIDRMWGNIGHTTLDISLITIHEVTLPTYTVYYDYDGGTETIPSASVIVGYSTVLPSTSKPNHKFLGWFTEKSGGERVGGAGDSYSNPLLGDGDSITLFAQWEYAEQNVVTFDFAGGSGRIVYSQTGPKSKEYGTEPVVLLEGETVVLPPAVRLGYIFDGWYDGENLVGRNGDIYQPVDDVTLTAHWTPIEYDGNNLLAGSDVDLSGGLNLMNVWVGWDELELLLGVAPNGGNAIYLTPSATGGLHSFYWQHPVPLENGKAYRLSVTYKNANGSPAGDAVVGINYAWSLGSPTEPIPVQVPLNLAGNDWKTGYADFIFNGGGLGWEGSYLLGVRKQGTSSSIYISEIRIEKLPETDKTLLNELIAEAEGKSELLYSPESWAAMQQALNTAKALAADLSATQAAIDEAAANLRNAIDNLVAAGLEELRADLLALIESAEALNQADYKSASWANLLVVLETARDVYNNAETETEITGAIEALQTAIGSLVSVRNPNLVINGDFSEGTNGWSGGTVVPNDGKNAYNTSDNMIRITSDHTRITGTNTITLTEPGKYRLSAWVKSPGTANVNAELFLTHPNHNGAPESAVDWWWDYSWESQNIGGANSRVIPSVVKLNGYDEWTYVEKIFSNIHQPLMGDAFEYFSKFNYQFKVAFRKEAGGGTLNITGIALEKLCDVCGGNPCICETGGADKSALVTIISAAESIINNTREIFYTPESWSALTKALNFAKTQNGRVNALQGEVDDAVSALENAVNGLTVKDIAELKALLLGLINEGLTYEEEDWKAISWTDFVTALANAQAVYGNASATNMEVIDAYEALSGAISRLTPQVPDLKDLIGTNFFPAGDFSEGLTGWDSSAGTILPNDNPANNQEIPNMLSVNPGGYTVIGRDISLRGNAKYRFSAWGKGGLSSMDGVAIGPKRGTIIDGHRMTHEQWDGSDARRWGVIQFNNSEWTYKSVDFVLETDVDGEIIIRLWPEASSLYLADIRVELIEAYDAYDIVYSVDGRGGTLNAAVNLVNIPTGSSITKDKIVVFTAKPDLGYVVDQWIVNGTVIGNTGNTFSTVVMSDLNVKVKFKPANSVALTYGVEGGNGSLVARTGGTTSLTSGTVVASGSTLAEGYPLAYYATPNAGYEVAYWIVNGKTVYSSGRLYTVASLKGTGEAGALTFDVKVVFQEIDPTGGRANNYNGTYKSKLGLNVSRPSSLSGGLNATFADDYLESLHPFSVLRFMDFTNTNGSYRPQDGVWNASNRSKWEPVIALANATKKDIWICIPVTATDDYIQNLATLMKENLNPIINVYVEWGNEVWGFADQKNVNIAMAAEKGIVDNRDPWSVYGVWHSLPEYYHFAQRTADIAFIFRDVFGESDTPINENSRVRPVLTWQVMSNGFKPMVDWLNGTNTTPGGLKSDEKYRNCNEYIWATGIAPYFGEPTASTCTSVEYVHRQMLNNIEKLKGTIEQVVRNANDFGFIGGAVTYEGGPHYNGNGSDNLNIRTAAQKDPVMTDLINYYILNHWYDLGGGLFTYFSHIGASGIYGYWGNLDNLTLEQFINAPKFAALKFVSQQPIGTVVPRPDVAPASEFTDPITNGSFESLNPKQGWTLGPGWVIDSEEFADGHNSLKVSAIENEWQETSWDATIELERNKDYVFVFWHKGLAGYKVIIGDGQQEYYAITEDSDEWTEYIIPFNTGDSSQWNIKIGHVPGAPGLGDAWFDFFYLEENVIANGSFEKGNPGWDLTNSVYSIVEAGETNAADGSHVLKISGDAGKEYNSAFSRVKRESEYRLIVYQKGDGDITIAFYDHGDFNTPYGPVQGSEIITSQNDGWTRYEALFGTHQMSIATQEKSGQIKISTTGDVGEAYIDNIILFLKKMPVPAEEEDPYVRLIPAKADITVDGVRDAGYTGPVTVATPHGSTPANAATGKVWTAWDDNALSFYIEVYDTTPNQGETQGDQVEIFIDWNSGLGKKIATPETPYWQVAVPADPNKSLGGLTLTGNAEDWSGFHWGSGDFAHLCEWVAVPLNGDWNNGYVIEIRIEAPDGVTLTEDKAIPVDFQICDFITGNTAREGQMFLAPNANNDQQWTDPSACMGVLVLGPASEPQDDTTPPVITLDQSSGTVTDAVFTISGRVSEACTLTVNGMPVTVGEDLRFSTEVNLTEGENIITVEAIDGANNVGTASITLIYQEDTGEPTDLSLDLVLDKAIVTEGDELLVTVKALNAAELKGFELNFEFDENVYEFISAELSSEFGDSGNAYFEYRQKDGLITLLGALLGKISREGDVGLVEIMLKAKDGIDAYSELVIAAGSDLSINENQLYTLDNDVIAKAPVANPDITGDGDGVRINDIVMVAGKFMAGTGDEDYDARLDMNKDGIIDLMDIVYMVRKLLGK